MWTSDGREQENLYDGEGLRAGLRENGKKISFLFYNGEILAECDGDGMPVRRHLPGIGLSYMQTLDDGMYHACYQDEQGSTAFITGDGGEVENSYVYDAFGNVLERKEGIRNDILYRGQKYDQEAGQYYLRARYYNPVIGRFIQEDSYRGDGLNLYAYCGNNPVMYYDPSGYTKVTPPTTEPEAPRTISDSNNYFVPVQQQMHDAVTEWTRMEESLADTNRKLNKFNTATVVYDARTGNYYYGMNRGIQLSGDNLNSSLSTWLPDATLDSRYRVGNCAEVDAINQALNSGANVGDLYMYTINTKDGAPKPMCNNCIYTFFDKVADILSE